ncbi:PCYCGC motif-containing (lipo)protein [Bacillus sp. V5-8f]|uniref:PCYCGC motif-containing (lipo)protein n=1 Tax=Bacillus sp. V5-8f TaxID=2053044 RepID=UPI000C76F06A|nr:PCYCGC motif-containing (lipo)protein [Bacillus sp. V5-8f]PLT34956.1 hypothetical protein CUU64_06070 [Bacillus sp. V5-8f]
MKKKFGIVASMILSSFLFLSGCGNETTSSQQGKQAGKETSSHKEEHQHHTSSGDIQEETKTANVMPDFLNGKPEEMAAIYAAAPKYQELLEHIPCYCGCNDSAGHRDNYDCFIHENKNNGAVVWDDHGTKCGVCLITAAESINQLNEGKSIKEIREYIDNKYKEGYPEPTPTPQPKG